MGKCSYCGKISGKYMLCSDCINMEKRGLITYCKTCFTVHAPNEKCNKLRHTTCDICNAPDLFGNGLCEKHLKLRDAGTIVKCKRCGNHHFFEEPCPCCFINLYRVNNKNDTSCIICGGAHPNGHICDKCSAEYEGKKCFFEINNGKTILFLREEYMGRYTCNDGHIVKSKSEEKIDNYLFEKKIRHVYEKIIFTDDETEIHPDFYLPDFDVYIEHWGYGKDNRDYTRIKEKKMKYYRRSGLTLICTYEQTDAPDIEQALDFKLNHFKKGQVNFENPNI